MADFFPNRRNDVIPRLAQNKSRAARKSAYYSIVLICEGMDLEKGVIFHPLRDYLNKKTGNTDY